MNVFFDYNSSWYVLLLGFLAAWAILLVVRRKWSSHEIKEQMLLALGGMVAMAMMELFAVSTGLWNYTPGNWPVILWPTYFAGILFGYQLLRSVERVLLRRPALM
jgi:drug/metabolite transporter (DMT)-like permease